MHAINQMNYPHVLLCGTVISLLAASCAYAVESPVTPGPSVGHRPVINGLILGTGNAPNGGDITLNNTILNVGDTIGLWAATGIDADGDLDKAGAHCVWYRVDPNTNAETVVRDPGAADRNCHYTIQAADIGFKIKNVIKIFSDQDIATTKGFTINPIDSWPVETLSSNEVQSYQPFEYIRLGVDSGTDYTNTINRNTINRFKFQSIHPASRIRPFLPGLIDMPLRSHTNEAVINADGWVTFPKIPVNNIIITGQLNGVHYKIELPPPKKLFEFIGTPNTRISLQDARAGCAAKGMRMPTLDEVYLPPNPGNNFDTILGLWNPNTTNGISKVMNNSFFRYHDPNEPDAVGGTSSQQLPPQVQLLGANQTDVGAMCVKDL